MSRHTFTRVRQVRYCILYTLYNNWNLTGHKVLINFLQQHSTDSDANCKTNHRLGFILSLSYVLISAVTSHSHYY